MTTDQPVRLLMLMIKQGMSLVTAAAQSGMSERTARKYRSSGKLPSALRAPHTWRTREDPFEAVWREVEALLEPDAGLQAKTVFEELVRRYPGRFQIGQLRTLQRRFRDWRALRGAAREIYFAQHPPSRGAEPVRFHRHGRTAGLRTRWTSGCGYAVAGSLPVWRRTGGSSRDWWPNATPHANRAWSRSAW